LNNLAIPLKIWTNNELTYRLRFGTGNFDGSGPNNENSNYIGGDITTGFITGSVEFGNISSNPSKVY
jgi:hypothetical protein